ncbi:MAG: 5-(carboxyamino)imidazole ribonucleotide synthase [Saprospiraceae bacterium]|nr:5-(carboxyamino)imidazole ribonucleotide synthase [Saprospiraceae bacterium]
MDKNIFSPTFKVGVLGGGQLGKMLALAAGNWHVQLHLLDKSKDFPAGPYSPEFVEGDFNKYEDVLQFGRSVDVLTIEIEHVNTEALLQLEQEGVIVHPNARSLMVIKDKGLQKQFYFDQKLPTSPCLFYDDASDLNKALDSGKLELPFVQKSRTAGYDGKGVAVIRTAADLSKLLDGPCIVEPLVDIDKEIALVAARNPSGQIEVFPPVEMLFHPVANLVEFLQCPATISDDQLKQAEAIVRSTIEAFDICGLLAVELFLTKSGTWLINEVAPRPHNSGHHTIDSCYTSQFEQHLRGILDLPLGSTKMKTPSVMINLLGEAGFTGDAIYEGMDTVLAIPGAKVHLYGKSQTKPFRKMGHATLLDETLEGAVEKAKKVKNILKIKA